MMKSGNILLNIFLSLMGGMGENSNLSIKQIDVNHASPPLIQQLKQFESSFVYPFSETEQFRIEHGVCGDYCAFFKRLGKPYYYVATCKKTKYVRKTVNGKQILVHHKAGEIAAAVCAVLRTIRKKDGSITHAWYICDLKVNEKYQGEHLPLKIMSKVAIPRFLQCPRGYGICMNPRVGEPKAAQIFKQHGPVDGHTTHILNLYTLTAEQVEKNTPTIEMILRKHGYLKGHDHIRFVTTSGVKDYQIFDDHNSRSWHLLHMHTDGYGSEAHKGAVHMLSAVQGTALDSDYKQLFGSPTSTAQIVSYGMKDFDFNELTTDQI